MRPSHKTTLLLIGFCLVLLAAATGCGSPYSPASVAGYYRCDNPSDEILQLWPPVKSVLRPALTLRLRADGTYEHMTYVPNPAWKTSSPGEVILPLTPLYEGKYTVEHKEVLLQDEPPEAYGIFEIVGKDLSNAVGLWVRQPEP